MPDDIISAKTIDTESVGYLMKKMFEINLINIRLAQHDFIKMCLEKNGSGLVYFHIALLIL